MNASQWILLVSSIIIAIVVVIIVVFSIRNRTSDSIKSSKTNDKSNNTYIKKQLLTGIGGWLILFQIRMYFGVVSLLAPFTSVYYPISYYSQVYISFDVIALILVAFTLIFFYMRKIQFRTIYIFAVLANLIVTYILTMDFLYILIVIAVESIYILALFRSRRVKYTFN